MLTKDRVIGMFLGTAIGDALFMPFETWTKEEIEQHGRISNYIRPDGHKWFDGRGAGTWTDDTQLTLAVAESLISKGKIDMDDLAQQHVVSLQKEGDLGFGNSTREAILRLSKEVHWSESGKTNNPKHGAGNGVAMKVGPIAAYLTKLKENRFNDLANLAAMTHATSLGIESGIAQVLAVKYCFNHSEYDFSVEEFIQEFRNNLDYTYRVGHTNVLLEQLLMLRYLPLSKMTSEDFIKLFNGGTCYISNSLPFSYAFFLRNPMSIQALYDVGHAGGDTDTNASMVGGLLGALNGSSIFPQHLIDGLWQKDRIIDTAERFCDKFKISNQGERV